MDVGDILLYYIIIIIKKSEKKEENSGLLIKIDIRWTAFQTNSYATGSWRRRLSMGCYGLYSACLCSPCDEQQMERNYMCSRNYTVYTFQCLCFAITCYRQSFVSHVSGNCEEHKHV